MNVRSVVKGVAVYSLLIILCIVSLYNLRNLTMSGNILPHLEDSQYDLREAEAAELFPDSQYVLIFYGRRSGESNRDYFKAMDTDVQRLRELSGVTTVLSPVDLRDQVASGDGFATASLYDGTPSSAETLPDRVARHHLFSTIFLAPENAEGYKIYCFYDKKEIADTFWSDLRTWQMANQDRKVSLLGYPVLEDLIIHLGLRDLKALGTLAFLIILGIEILYMRSISYGLVFSVITMLPAVYVLGLFPLFNISFSIFLIPVPILTLILSTSYSLHVIHYTLESPARPIAESLRKVFPVVCMAGGTTLMGFITMLLAPLQEMRSMGLLMALGILVSFGITFLTLPPLLPGYLRYCDRKNYSSLLSRRFGKKALGSRGVFFLLIVISSGGAAGLLCAPSKAMIMDYTLRESPSSRYVQDYRRITGASHLFEMVIDFGEEYGFISLARYDALGQALQEIRSMPAVTEVFSIMDFVPWMNGILEGSEKLIDPGDEIQLGESLELIFSGDVGLNPASLITPDYSAVKVQFFIQAGRPGRPYSSLSAGEIEGDLLTVVEGYFPGQRILVLSDGLMEEGVSSRSRNSIFVSLLIFFPLVFLVLSLIMKSIWLSFVTILPSLASAVLFLGIMGFGKLIFSAFSALSICMLIGVCLDDAVILTRFYLGHLKGYKTKEEALIDTLDTTGAVIIRTTVIIVAAVAVLLFSLFLYILQNGVLMIICFLFATAFTLFVLPQLLLIVKPAHSRKKP